MNLKNTSSTNWLWFVTAIIAGTLIVAVSVKFLFQSNFSDFDDLTYSQLADTTLEPISHQNDSPIVVNNSIEVVPELESQPRNEDRLVVTKKEQVVLSRVETETNSKISDNAQINLYPDSTADTSNQPITAVMSHIQSEESPQNIVSKSKNKGNLSIVGRVLNDSGNTVPDIVVSAQSTTRQSNDSHSTVRTQSDDAGNFEIQDLAAGEYRLTTRATDVYPSSVIVVRAGLQSADIVLVAGYEKIVFGTVTDTTGAALSNVEVSLNYPRTSTSTDDEGRYELIFTAQGNRRYSFNYELGGYSDKTTLLPAQDFASERTQIDVKLMTQGNTVMVSGSVISDFGDAVQGARIDLSSGGLGTRYAGRSDEQGNFSISDVQPGNDYQLSVQTNQLYERFWKKLVVTETDNTPFDITLNSISGGKVTGNMEDVYGNIISNFALVVRSSKMSRYLTVKGDELGYFEVEGVPEGDLTFATQSNPYLTVSGVSLEQGQDVQATLLLDWGNYEFAVRILDGNKIPIQGAKLSLTWSSGESGLVSGSSRHAITDINGLSRFSNLGPGSHAINVNAPGYKRHNQIYEVGVDVGDIVIELEDK